MEREKTGKCISNAQIRINLGNGKVHILGSGLQIFYLMHVPRLSLDPSRTSYVAVATYAYNHVIYFGLVNGSHGNSLNVLTSMQTFFLWIQTGRSSPIPFLCHWL